MASQVRLQDDPSESNIKSATLSSRCVQPSIRHERLGDKISVAQLYSFTVDRVAAASFAIVPSLTRKSTMSFSLTRGVQGDRPRLLH